MLRVALGRESERQGNVQYELYESKNVLAEADMRRCPRCRKITKPNERVAYNRELKLVWHEECSRNPAGLS